MCRTCLRNAFRYASFETELHHDAYSVRVPGRGKPYLKHGVTISPVPHFLSCVVLNGLTKHGARLIRFHHERGGEANAQGDPPGHGVASCRLLSYFAIFHDVIQNVLL